MTISLRFAARSDVGLVRQSNQDSGYAGPHLCVLCDGMGGPAGGDIASAVAVEHLMPLDADSHQAGELLGLMRDAVQAAHTELVTLSSQDPDLAGLGTTCIGVMRSGNKLAMVHVGDSRAYMLRDGTLTQVTTDYEGTQIKAGLIPTDDAHGAQILARFAWFEDRYAELTRAFYDFGEPRRAEWFEWDRKTDAERLEVRAAALDSLDDAISNASDLLTMSQSWREAWRNEQGPVREDLASFRKLCSSVQAKGELDITQERIWLKASLDRMAAMTNEMEAGALSPSAALDELDTISQDVRTRAESLARRALKADTSSYRNGRLHRYESSQSRRVRNSDAYAGWWLFDGHRISYDPASTIRINPSSVGANASGVHWTGAGSAAALRRSSSRRERSSSASTGAAARELLSVRHCFLCSSSWDSCRTHADCSFSYSVQSCIRWAMSCCCAASFSRLSLRSVRACSSCCSCRRTA